MSIVIVNDAPYEVEDGDVLAFCIESLDHIADKKLIIRPLGIDNEKYIIRKDIDHIWNVYRLRGREWVRQ